MTLSRRRALQVVGALVGYLHGKPVAAIEGSAPQMAPRGLALILDGLDGIVLQYRGQRVVIQPVELMAALAPDGPPTSMYQQSVPHGK